MKKDISVQFLCKDCESYGLCEYYHRRKRDSYICKYFHLPDKALEQEPCEDMGEVSDGYHTFNQLYHQRAVLFATIVNSNKDKAWKSFKHSDGKYCFDSNGEWFIVGVDTPQGSYTYHYEKKYWDMFDCKELQCGKEWDGHTEEDVTRLLSLEQEPCEDAISRRAVLEKMADYVASGYADSVEDFEEYSRIICQLPPVTPQPKIGHWIDDEFGSKCSCCNIHTHLNKFDRPMKFKYCSMCGAKMEGSEEV